MYVPNHFRETDSTVLADLIDAHSFGTLVSVLDARPFASHVPFVHDAAAGLLHCHLARANPQWRGLDAREALVIFLGPHAYFSPTVYTTPGVPTWNYAAVHVYGRVRVVEDAASIARHVEALAARHERGRAAPWVPSYDARRLASIVGLEIRIDTIEGKLKLSQNRPAADREAVIADLAARGRDTDAALAALMRSVGTAVD